MNGSQESKTQVNNALKNNGPNNRKYRPSRVVIIYQQLLLPACTPRLDELYW